MNKVHIAIIDDGVNDNYYNDLNIKYNLNVNEELIVEKRQNYNSNAFSHGTVCAGIIRKYCKSAIISSIKVLDNDKSGNKNKLIKAIEWCINNKINVINLSIGTISRGDKRELKNIIDKAYQKGIVIIAANKNQSIITYPAFFNNVIGVKCDKQNKLKEGQFEYNFGNEDQIEISACGSNYLVNYEGISKKEKNCNSFAAPMITAIVSNILNESFKLSINEIRKELWRLSLNYSQNFMYCQFYNNLEWITNALIFNINNNTYLSVEKFVFGVKKIVNIEATTDIDTLSNRISNYLQLNKDVLNNIDTIIIDYKNLITPDSYSALEKIVKSVFNYRKNIVFLNDCINDKNIIKLLSAYSSITYSYQISNFYNDKILKTSQDERPLILIINVCQQNILLLLLRLNEYFNIKAYNTTVFTDDFQGVYYGFKYLPISNNSFSKSERELYNILNYYVILNNSDIGIVGLNASRIRLSDKEYFNKLEYIDMLILIYDNNIICKYKNDEIEQSSIIKQHNNILANFSDNVYAEFLYKIIISVYEEE